jgi:hypothetical protein
VDIIPSGKYLDVYPFLSMHQSKLLNGTQDLSCIAELSKQTGINQPKMKQRHESVPLISYNVNKRLFKLILGV